jgi:uncharacterized protein
MKCVIPEAALNQHIAVLGKTGSGKSYCCKGIVEHLLEQKRQVCILDPTSAWFGLRLAADGKSRGFDVVLLGGQHADIPLAERSGSAVARLVTEQGANVVLDTSGFTVGEYTRWFIDFAGTLFTTIRNPLHLVIDEAHHFMPQGKSPDVDAGKMLHAGNRLMSGGRSKGVRGMLITQRPAKLHKDSLSCADTLIAMRVIAPQDRSAIKEWIDGAGDPTQGKAVLDSLAQLQRGEGWVWYPEGGHLERVHFPKIKTYDSSATPAHGAKAGPKVAEIDLAEVQRAMAEAVKEAEANDPKLLRAKIADLSKQLSKSASGVQTVVDQAAIDRAVAAAIREYQKGLKERDGIIDQLKGRMTKAADLLHVNGEASGLISPPDLRLAQQGHKTAENRSVYGGLKTAPTQKVSQPVKTRAEYTPDHAGEIAPRAQRFLDAAAALTTLNSEVTRETVSAWVGVHPRGGSVGEVLKDLEEQGMIVVDRGRISVTDAGQAAAGHVDPSEAIERAKSGLTARQARFFEVICEAYPEATTREAIAERFELHPRGGSLGEDLGRLVGRGLVEASRGQYRARDFLFAGT